MFSLLHDAARRIALRELLRGWHGWQEWQETLAEEKRQRERHRKGLIKLRHPEQGRAFDSWQRAWECSSPESRLGALTKFCRAFSRCAGSRR